MADLPKSLDALVEEFSKLPGIGRKTAQRLALHLLRIPQREALALAQAIVDVKEKIRRCSLCFNIAEEETCAICRDVRREQGVICVVETASDLLALERTNQYRGLYHVLEGALSPLDGIGPDDLRIKELLSRLNAGVKEVIVATNPDVEGEATALYLMNLIRSLGIRVTRIARGLPMGGDLEFADQLTLARALEGRTEI